VTNRVARRGLLVGGAAALAAPAWLRAQPVAFAAADLAHAAALRDAALADRTTAWRVVERLTLGIGARPAGSEAEARAAQEMATTFTGLKLAAARVEGLPLRIWQRGPASAELLTPASEPLVMAALGNSVATPADGIEAELVYYPDFAALQADDSGRARGRIVFIDERTERSTDGRGYGRAVVARANGAIEAARRGALAAGIRSIGTDRTRVAHTGAMRYDLQLPRIPGFAVSVPDAERIAELQAAGRPLRMRLKLDSRSGVDATTHNVIAEVPGGQLANEIVLIGAHLDSWDLGQGALDDASGVGIVASAAAAIRAAGRTPRRTVRVVLFGNEENGFDGARAYGDRYGSQPHQLVSESDFGAGRPWRLRSRVRPEALPLVGAIAAVLAPLGVAWPDEGRNEGSPGPDAALLMRRHKWPAIGITQDGSAYFDVHHTVNDTLDKVDPAGLAHNAACWATVAWLAAQSPLPFGPLT